MFEQSFKYKHVHLFNNHGWWTLGPPPIELISYVVTPIYKMIPILRPFVSLFNKINSIRLAPWASFQSCYCCSAWIKYSHSCSFQKMRISLFTRLEVINWLINLKSSFFFFIFFYFLFWFFIIFWQQLCPLERRVIMGYICINMCV